MDVCIKLLAFIEVPYQYIYEHRQTAKQQIVQDLTMGLSMHSGTLEHICIDPEGPECYCASFY